MAAAAAEAEVDSCLQSFELYEAESVSSSPPPDHNAPFSSGLRACGLLRSWIISISMQRGGFRNYESLSIHGVCMHVG
jgi:hypothetical protein